MCIKRERGEREKEKETDRTLSKAGFSKKVKQKDSRYRFRLVC
jgi:hypothetical protein